MYMFRKQLRTFIFFFSVLLFTSAWGMQTHITFNMSPMHQTHDKIFNTPRSGQDFSHDGTRDYHRISSHRVSRSKSYDKYDRNDFRHHFAARGYTESQILNQRCLYMFDEFVQYAQTYSCYARTIEQMHAELKNLTRLQKICYTVKGTYCRGLQERIQCLYNELNTIKTMKPHNNDNFNYQPHFICEPGKTPMLIDNSIGAFQRQLPEYNALESTYSMHTKSLVSAIDKRIDAYNSMTGRDYALEYVGKSYNLNNNVIQLLHKYGHDESLFTRSFGHQLHRAIHQESLDILERAGSLSYDSLLYDHQEALVDFAIAIVEYNNEGHSDKATQIGDLCWTLLDYGQAIAEGAALGLYSAAHDILNNPIEAVVCVVAGKEVLAYQLCKVLYNVADIGLTAIADVDCAKEKWNKYAEPLNNVIDAINKKEITLRDGIKGGTALVVGWKAQGRLLGGLGKFCNAIKQNAIRFVKNNGLLNPQGYLTTPEGLLFKATIESMKSAQEKIINNLPIPQFIKDDRVPLDKETILSSAMFKKTKIPSVKGAQVYTKDNLFYHRDTFHTGKGAHLEVYNKRGLHLGEADLFTGILRSGTADKTKNLYL